MNREYLKEIAYEGYYDECGKLHIDLNKKDAEEVIKRLMGADEVCIKN